MHEMTTQTKLLKVNRWLKHRRYVKRIVEDNGGELATTSKFPLDSRRITLCDIRTSSLVRQNTYNARRVMPQQSTITDDSIRSHHVRLKQ